MPTDGLPERDDYSWRPIFGIPSSIGWLSKVIPVN